jgi:hypothetical protein
MAQEKESRMYHLKKRGHLQPLSGDLDVYATKKLQKLFCRVPCEAGHL